MWGATGSASENYQLQLPPESVVRREKPPFWVSRTFNAARTGEASGTPVKFRGLPG